MSENFNIQEIGPRQSTRLNVTIGGAAPPPRVSTTGTTGVATLVATCGEVHGTTTTTRVVPPKQSQVEPTKAQGTMATAQASHSRASRTEQLIPTAQPALVVSQAAQVGPRLSQPSGPIIEPRAFSPHFFADLTFPNSNLVFGVNHPSTAQGGIFLPSSSNPNGEQHLSRQVIELRSTLA
ncbi:hypothetical protein ACFX2A_032142 [Malus domestica]